MADAKRGDLVQIHRVLLGPDQRPEGLPPSTREVPYECWIKGFLAQEEANLGEEVVIRTFIGREITGVLCSVAPTYDHGFGRPQSELLRIGEEAKALIQDR
jgi:hypothetical protein